jgi:hypothetical protein
MSFFELDDILCEEQLIRTRVSLDIPWNGCLYTQDPVNEEESDLLGKYIRQGQILELPLWIAYPMFLNDFAELSKPKCFGTRMREKLQMGPVSVSLYDASPFYISFAKKMMFIWLDETLYQLILISAMQRLSEIVRMAINHQQVLFQTRSKTFHNRKDQDLASLDQHPLYAKLDNSERLILKLAKA